ncbi:MAG: transposase [Bacteroidota bacterium]
MDQDLLDLYTDYLIASFGQASATGLERLTDRRVSHDRVTRLLSVPPRTGADLWRAVKPLVRQVQCDEAVLIFDDTIEEKPYTDENDIVAWHFDHTKGRSVKGINLVTALYGTPTVNVPVSFAVVAKTEAYTDQKTGKLRRRSPTTKNEQMRAMLRACIANELPFRYVLADIWYGSSENMRVIHLDLKRHFCGYPIRSFPIKRNRLVALSAADHASGSFVHVSAASLEPDRLYRVHLKEVPFAVSVVRQVFTGDATSPNEDGSSGERYLVTSDEEATSEALRAAYQRRWRVEEYHRSLKQNASLAKSPTRRVATQTNHLFCSLLAYVKLERLRVSAKANHYALKGRLYVRALHSAFEELRRLKQGYPALAA